MRSALFFSFFFFSGINRTKKKYNKTISKIPEGHSDSYKFQRGPSREGRGGEGKRKEQDATPEIGRP